MPQGIRFYFSRKRGGSFGEQIYLLAGKTDPLPRTQLGTLAELHLPIDQNPPFFDNGVCCTAGIDQSCGLEQLIELNEFAANGKRNRHQASTKMR